MLLPAVIIYVVLLLVVLVFQRRFIYFPTRIPGDVIESIARDHGFEPWRNTREEIIGWKIRSAGPAKGSVLIVHGNAGCALGRDYVAQPIHEAGGMDVFVLEYPGYGARGGSPSKGAIVAAAEEAFAMLPTHLPRYIVSESIGVGAACELAAAHPDEVAGLALIVPFANMAAVAQRRMPFFPAYFLLRDRFNRRRCLARYGGPVLFVVAGADEILGAATGRRLYDGYAGGKRLIEMPGAGHNEVAAQSADWWLGVIRFWQAAEE